MSEAKVAFIERTQSYQSGFTYTIQNLAKHTVINSGTRHNCMVGQSCAISFPLMLIPVKYIIECLLQDFDTFDLWTIVWRLSGVEFKLCTIDVQINNPAQPKSICPFLTIKNNLQMNLASLALLFPSLVLALPTIGEVPTGREVPRSLSSNLRPNLGPNLRPNSKPNLRTARPNYDSISLLVTGAPYPSLWSKPSPSLITKNL